MPLPGVPILNKTCPFGYSIDSATGLCTLFNPWTVGAVILGSAVLGAGIGEAAAAVHRNPRRDFMIAASGLGAGIAAGLIAKAFMAPPLPAASQAPIPSKVVQARKAQAARRTIRAISPPAVMMAPCHLGCRCIAIPSDWCTDGQKLINPQSVNFLVTFAAPAAAPPQYDFTANVAQWIGFFTYKADPEGDTWCPPTQTYSTGMGDCEDLSMLVVSVLLAGYVDASLIVGMVDDPQGTFGHAWVEGVDGLGWFLIESTNGKLYRDQRPAIYTPTLRVRSGQCTWNST